MIRLRYWLVSLIWDFGTWLRERACVMQGGQHDYLPSSNDCLVCGHNPFKEIR